MIFETLRTKIIIFKVKTHIYLIIMIYFKDDFEVETKSVQFYLFVNA